VLAVGSRTATINGESRTLAIAPFVSAGNVMIPLRLVSEAAGASVAYSSTPHSVSVTRAPAATGAAAAGAAAAGAGAAAVSGAAAPAAAPAATDVASAAPVADTQTNQSGIPWWVWALLGLLLLALIVWALTRRKKEPIITTTSTVRRKEPTITTTGKNDEPTITTRK
jgi:LPXTG-motif cell wall-anchored protein